MKTREWLFVLIVGGTFTAIAFFTTSIFTIAFHTSKTTVTLLYGIAGLLTLASLLSFLGSRGVPHLLERVSYLMIMSLIAYATYFFLISIPLAVIISIAAFTGMTIPLIIPWVALAIALCAGLIGHIQSWHIKTTSYDVVVESLPAWWKGKRAVFLSDTHFGMVRHERFARHIVKKILSLTPAIIFHGGDFYDGPDIQTTAITNTWKEITEKIPMFYSSGNHEHYGNYPRFIESIKAAGITVLEDEKTIYEGMEIVGIVYRGKHEESEVREVLEELRLDPLLPKILINHPPTFHHSARKAGISLMLSGHTHNGQFWPGTYLTRVIYGIFHYGKREYNGMTTITSRGVGTAGPPLRFLNPPELVVINFV